jgi:uncharacterized protein (TIGR02466 family)
MQIKNYFTSPFMYEETNEINLCENLEKFILGSMNENTKIKNAPQSSHPDLFESEFNFLNWNNPLTNQLKKIILEYLLGFIKSVNNFDAKTLASMRFNHESWFHVVQKGGYFQAHTHPNHAWSVVFCVNPGDDNIDNEFEAGKLLFVDPRMNAAMYLDPSNSHLKREYSFNGFKTKLKKGGILIFPSYLQHSVEPYFGEEHRITVAANFRFHTDD